MKKRAGYEVVQDDRDSYPPKWCVVHRSCRGSLERAICICRTKSCAYKIANALNDSEMKGGENENRTLRLRECDSL